MRITTRPAVIGDAEVINTLSRDALGYDFPLEQTRQKLEALLLSPRDRIIIAEAGGRAVGYIHACDYDVLYAPPMKNILGLAVDESCRRQGAGRALLSSAEEWARQSGASGVRLASGGTRHGAHEFYRRMGYAEKPQLRFIKML